ncbi:hypothetical protein [Umezawaea sp. NPDC059074]|uniref:hypothetical protein n=1 Tax=Umezawaea sp. NPDC059074 TaxID=3346716 RepID=UPI0036BF5434
MANWFTEALNRPRGFSADGRVLGLGLATALEAQRRKDESVTGVEDYLRETAAKDQGSSAMH